MGENVRFIDSVIRYAGEKIFSACFEKAFDSLERSCILDGLCYLALDPHSFIG